MTGENKKYLTRPSLVGQQIYLRPKNNDDEVLFNRWKEYCEPQSMTVHSQLFYTEQEISQRPERKPDTDKHQFFAIVLNADDKVVGKVSYFSLNYLNRSAELGVLIDPDQHNKGYASDALRLLINYLFRFMNLHKVYATTSENNSNTIKLLKTLGFHQDGIMRDHHFYNGKYYNQLIFSLISNEFK